MAESFSSVLFHLQQAGQTTSSWNIKRFPEDCLSDLLERLSQKSNIPGEDFCFVYQVERGKTEGEQPCYFAETVKGDTQMLASHDRIEELEKMNSDQLPLYINAHISKLDDVFCPPGLSPIISIDMRTIFFELNGSKALDGSARALDDRHVVAWFEAYRVSDVKGKMAPVVLLHSMSRCVDVRSGEQFDTHGDFLLASRIPPGDARVEFGFLLLRHKAWLPKWPLSPDLSTHIAVREGVDFVIHDGLIVVKQTPAGAPSRRWMYPQSTYASHLPLSKPHVLRQRIMDYITS